MLRDISKAGTPVLLRVDVSMQVEQEDDMDIGWMLIRAQSCAGNLLCINSVLNLKKLGHLGDSDG